MSSAPATLPSNVVRLTPRPVTFLLPAATPEIALFTMLLFAMRKAEKARRPLKVRDVFSAAHAMAERFPDDEQVERALNYLVRSNQKGVI